MRKIFISILILLLAGYSVKAQLGITRDGKLQNVTASPCRFHYDVWAPKYLPKTKTVKIKVSSLEYDILTDEWKSAGKDDVILHYDSTGNIYSVEFPDTEYYSGAGEIKEGRITEMAGFLLKYDQNGYLSKMIMIDGTYQGVWRVKWTSQGYLSTKKKEYEGAYKYVITQNGRYVEEIKFYGESDEVTHKHIYSYDSHGVLTKCIYWAHEKDPRKQRIVFYDNKYNDNGNLIQHIPYRIVDGEKEHSRYDYGHLYEYEYVFY